MTESAKMSRRNSEHFSFVVIEFQVYLEFCLVLNLRLLLTKDLFSDIWQGCSNVNVNLNIYASC